MNKKLFYNLTSRHMAMLLSHGLCMILGSMTNLRTNKDILSFGNTPTCPMSYVMLHKLHELAALQCIE